MTKTINKMSMTSMILKHLEDKGSITNIEAQALYRCRALPRRIADLKEIGFSIASVMKRDATNQRYVRYYLVG